ncbi:MAG: hypothetical protein J6T91_02365 [Alphaproteobacteria bacterium]|nr:hypothetical protein [Alphaproteobacteria bacterium]
MWYRLGIFLLCCGCSVRPLHEFRTESEYQNNIHVDVIAEKNGQMLRGYLQDLIRDLDVSDEKYVLSVNLQEKRIPYALADDCNAQRVKVNLIANIVLKNAEGKNVVVTSVTGSTTRNIANAQGDVLLSMYDGVGDAVLKDLAFRIVENLKIALVK